MTSNMRRITLDLQDVQKCNLDPELGISVILNNGLRGFDAFIKGPANTPYEGGIFKVQISIPSEYPMKPPLAMFLTKVWHPNISSDTGYTCLDILGNRWMGAMSFRTILLSLQNLLLHPEPSDPQDAPVGSQALRDPAIFTETARMWTHFFAGGKDYDKGLKMELDRMSEMGYEQQNALLQLSLNDWDIAEALEAIHNV